MRLIIHILLFLFISTSIIAKEKGQTEITTEDGIEVFQNEKYYLLKKNVKIHSDNFILRADIVKINFNKNLYDITKIDAKGTVNFDSSKNKMNGIGEKLVFDVQNEIYPKLEKSLLDLLHNSGFPEIKFEKKVDFENLYKEKFN